MKAYLEIWVDEILVILECEDSERLHTIESNTSLPCDVVPMGCNVYQYTVSIDDVPDLVIELINYGVKWC